MGSERPWPPCLELVLESMAGVGGAGLVRSMLSEQFSGNSLGL